MNRFLKTSIFAISTLTASLSLAAAEPVTLQAMQFTKDQLATALQGVVDKINKCNGDMKCLNDVRAWNEAAMNQVKGEAVKYDANKPLSLELICGTDPKSAKTFPQTVTTDPTGKFTLTPPAANCMVKGLDPKCGAIERDKHFPAAQNGQMLYCAVGDETKLKATTQNLRDAVINSMKAAMKAKVQQGTAPAAPAAPAQ